MPGESRGVSLMRTGQYIPVSEDAEIYGLGSGTLVVADSDSITCYNKRLRKTYSAKLSPDEKAASSNNGRYWGIVKPSELDGFGEKLGRIEVFDNRGRPQWVLDGIPDGELYLSPAGDYLAVIKGNPGFGNTEMFIFHRDSVAVRDYVQECTDIVFSDNGSRIFVNSDAAGLKMYDDDGVLLANFGFQQNCAFSENSKLSACFSQGMLLVIRDTAVITQIDIGEMQMIAMAVSDSLDRIFCIAGYRLIAVDYENDSIDWDFRLETASEKFMNIDISDDRRFLALGLCINRGMLVPREERIREGYLYFFNVGGDGKSREKFTFDRYITGTPRVAFWPDGRSILVRTYGRIDVVELR
jgi:hypothetical protein